MSPLGQFHQHHANVLHHRQHHLTQCLQLGMRVDTLVGGAGGQRLDACHRGHAVGKSRRGTKGSIEIGRCAKTARRASVWRRPPCGGVSQAVMQQGRSHGIRPYPQFSHDQRRADAMRERMACPQLLMRMLQRAPGQIVFRHRQHARQRLSGGFEIGRVKTTGLYSFGHGCEKSACQ